MAEYCAKALFLMSRPTSGIGIALIIGVWLIAGRCLFWLFRPDTILASS